MQDRMIKFLLENAGPSIKYRVKKEILGDITAAEEKDLQEQIMAEPISQLVVNCQKENGWLGNGFHGSNSNAGTYENQEIGTKYLAEKGVPKDNPVLKRAMDAFVTTELSDLCYRTKGKVFDEFKYAANGQNIIRCACIARAGYDDVIDIKPQIQLSLDSFKRVLEVNSIMDIVKARKGKPIRSNPSGIYYTFNDFEKWPCRYHFDILSHTKSWKSEENIAMLAASFKKLMRTDRSEFIGKAANSWVGYQLGTVGCFSEGFSLRNSKDNSLQFETVEWLCRCGLAPHLEELQKEIEVIKNSINEHGICEADVDIEQLKGIGTYAGLQIEADWKTDTARLCDITFRALLILHYSGQ
jgi:hypothetical protein